MTGRTCPAASLQAVDGSVCLRDVSQIVFLGRAAHEAAVKNSPFKGIRHAFDMTDVSDEEEPAPPLSASYVYLFTDDSQPPSDANTLSDEADTSELSTSCQKAFNPPDASTSALSIPVQHTLQHPELKNGLHKYLAQAFCFCEWVIIVKTRLGMVHTLHKTFSNFLGRQFFLVDR